MLITVEALPAWTRRLAVIEYYNFLHFGKYD